MTATDTFPTELGEPPDVRTFQATLREFAEARQAARDLERDVRRAADEYGRLLACEQDPEAQFQLAGTRVLLHDLQGKLETVRRCAEHRRRDAVVARGPAAEAARSLAARRGRFDLAAEDLVPLVPEEAARA
jgi:hypothetical protein